MVGKKRGMSLVVVLIFIVLFLIMGITIVMFTISNIKLATEMRKDMKRFYGAEGGIFAIAGWMVLHAWQAGTSPPDDVLNTEYYKAEGRDLPGMHYLRGYSQHWRGLPYFINSQAPPKNPTAEIEAIVLIPRKASYGNE